MPKLSQEKVISCTNEFLCDEIDSPELEYFPFFFVFKSLFPLSVSKILCLLMLRPVVLCSFLELHWLLSRLPFLSIVLRVHAAMTDTPAPLWAFSPLNGTIVPETKGPQYTKLQKPLWKIFQSFHLSSPRL